MSLTVSLLRHPSPLHLMAQFTKQTGNIGNLTAHFILPNTSRPVTFPLSPSYTDDGGRQNTCHVDGLMVPRWCPDGAQVVPGCVRSPVVKARPHGDAVLRTVLVSYTEPRSNRMVTKTAW
jgi:hypothetical protein